MSKIEYFNAKTAGDYLGDQWVVRGSDFDNLESYHHRLRKALENALEWIDAVPNDVELPTMPGFDRDDVDGLLYELNKLENGS